MTTFAVSFGENHGSTRVANELVGTLDHAVALTGGGCNNLAGGGDLEPLFAADFVFILGILLLRVLYRNRQTRPISSYSGTASACPAGPFGRALITAVG